MTNRINDDDLKNVSGGITTRDGFQIYQNFNMMLLNEKDEVTFFVFDHTYNRFVSKGNVILDRIINNNGSYDVEFIYSGQTYHLNVAASAVGYTYAIGPKDQVNPF